jgi:peptidyl-prolyl cis-trans isomerase C
MTPRRSNHGARIAAALAFTLAAHSREAHAQNGHGTDGGLSLSWRIDASVPDVVGTTVQVTALAGPSSPLATGRGISVTAGDLQERVRDANELEQRRFAADPAALEALVDRLVADRALAAEARRRGLESDPAVRAAVERALIARLRATVLNPTADAARVTEAETRAFYQTNGYRFHVPERRRVAVLFTADLPRLERETRRWRRLTPTALRAAFRDLTRVMTTDEELVRAQYELVDVTQDREDLDPGLRAATFSIRDEGGISSPTAGHFRGRRGYWLVRLIDKRPAIERSFEDSADWIRGRIAAERRLQVERDAVQRLLEQSALRRAPAASAVRVEVVPTSMDAGLPSPR